MLSATTSQVGTASEQAHSISTTYSCNLCQISFQTGQDQRTHMKEPWHVYNIKQRIASLPAVPLDVFEAQAEKDSKPSKPSSGRRPISKPISGDEDEEEESDDEGDQDEWPYQCLFCNHALPHDDDDDEGARLEANIEHMYAAHGLFIPDAERVEDLRSFVGYLATEIRAWHECLYCGATKASTPSIQSHMRDKGHCLLNLDREPELLEFWESSGSVDGGEGVAAAAAALDLSAAEIILASGRVIGSKNAAPAIRRAARKQELAIRALQAAPEDDGVAGASSTENAQRAEDGEGAEGAELSEVVVKPPLSSGRQLARGDEMGMAGVSAQQRQALVLAEKKAQRSEATARRAREWVYARGGNLQKYDQVDGKMKMGKQNHKLQPR